MARHYNPINRYWTNDGLVLDSGTVEFLDPDTSVRIAIFSDSTLDTAATNPQTLDATGRMSEVFFDGSANVIVRNSAGVQQDQDNPVGGEQQTGEFTLWNALITYIVGSIVKGSDGKFYISLVDPNTNNNPVSPSPASWSEIRFIGMYNASETYSIGDVIQDSNGDLWKSVVNSNLANTPSTDTGANWLNAIATLWVLKSAAFNILPDQRYTIDASAGSVDAALPTTVTIGKNIIVHNESISTNTVRLTNTTLTLKGPDGSVTTSDNLVLAAGDTVHLVAKTTLIMEVV
jgi:hypothetical protein